MSYEPKFRIEADLTELEFSLLMDAYANLRRSLMLSGLVPNSTVMGAMASLLQKIQVKSEVKS